MKKRRNGEGSVYRDRGWRAVFSYMRDGKRHRIKRGPFATEEEADTERLRLVLQHREGGITPLDDRTMREYLTLWLLDDDDRRPATRENYEYHVRRNLIPVLGDVRLRDLDIQHVRLALRAARDRGLSPLTVQGMRKVLHTAMEAARRGRLVSENVVSLVTAPRSAVTERPILDEQQAPVMRATVEKHRLMALFVMASTIAMRQGELLGLTWANVDIDSDSPRLDVRLALKRYGGAFHLDEPKSPRSRRTIQLPEIVTTALRAHRARQAEERMRAGAAYATHDLVFATERGEPIDRAGLRRIWIRVLEDAGLPYVRFHDLRHTSVTFLLALGGDPATVQGVVGHATMGMTMEHYRHLDTGPQKRLMQLVDERLA